MLNAKEARHQTEQNITEWRKEQENLVEPFINIVNLKIIEAIDKRQFTITVDFPFTSRHNSSTLETFSQYQENYICSYYQKLKYRAHVTGDKFFVGWDDDSQQMSIK